MTTREMLEEVRVDCGASGSSVQVGIDVYLRNAPPEELLEAAVWYYRTTIESLAERKSMLAFLRLGFALAQPGGWERVAPWWLRESKKLTALDQLDQ